MKSWRRPWQATGDKSNGGHPHGASRSNRVIPSPATPLTGQRTPLHRHRSATPYGLRSAVASPLSTGPQQALRKLRGRFARVAVINRDSTNKPRASEGNNMTPVTKSTDEPPISDRPSARLQDPLLRPEEAARLLSVRTSWIYEAVRARRLPCVRVGRHIRFTQRMLEDWLADNIHARPAHAPHAASPVSPALDPDARRPPRRLQSGGHG
jgi:excisionase family DNA binding protein